MSSAAGAKTDETAACGDGGRAESHAVHVWPQPVISLLVTGLFHSTEGAAAPPSTRKRCRVAGPETRVDIRRLLVTSEQCREPPTGRVAARVMAFSGRASSSSLTPCSPANDSVPHSTHWHQPSN